MRPKTKQDKIREQLKEIGIIAQAIWFVETFGWQMGGWFFEAPTLDEDGEEQLQEFYLGRRYDAAVLNITNKNIITWEQYEAQRSTQ